MSHVSFIKDKGSVLIGFPKVVKVLEKECGKAKFMLAYKVAKKALLFSISTSNYEQKSSDFFGYPSMFCSSI